MKSMTNSSSSTRPSTVKPEHYCGEIECFDAMKQQFGLDAVITFCKLNIFKYVWRCNKKNKMEDLDKANQYYLRLNEFVKERDMEGYQE